MSLTLLETGAVVCDEDFYLIAESIPHIVWMAGSDGSIEYFNVRGSEYAGWARGSGLGWNWVELIHPDDVTEAMAGWACSTEAGEPYDDRFRLRRFDGSYRWHAVRGLPVRDTEGRIKKWIGTATDVDEERRARQELSCAEHRYRQLTLATAGAIAASVDARDPYTAGHQRRVAAISAAIGAELHLPDVDIEGIRLAASIHDIGKLGVPLELLACPRRLVPAEFELIKTHAQIGHDIVAGIEFPWPVADMIVQHHERLDGSGYPNGLTGDEIVVGARIIAVADTVEAMGSHRPFRPARGLDVALDEIKVNAGRLYDQSVASACDELFRSGRLQLDTLA